MGLRRESFSTGEHYHLYSRGTDKREIFLDKRDRDRFIKLLFICNSDKPVVFREVENLPLKDIERGKQLVAVGSYCLMKNHFHLLIRETSEGGTVTFIRKLLTAYSVYFNKKYDRTGTLFSSRFKSSHLSTDNYLKYMFSYIHHNPLKLLDKDWRSKKFKISIVKEHLKKYQYSSYNDYCGENRESGLILNREAFPDYFENKGDFEKEIYSWLLLTKDGPM